MKMIAVFFDHFRCVLHIRFLVQQPGQTLDIDLDRDQGRQGCDDPLHRLQHTDRIGHKYRQCTDPDDTFHGQPSAPPQDQGERHGRKKGDHRCQKGAVMRSPHGRPVHAAGLILKSPLHHVLDPQGLDALDTGNALIEIARDPGIDLTHLPASGDDLFLKIQDDQDRGRHHDQDVQGQAGIDHQHHHRHTDNIGYIPDHIHHAPGHQFPDPLRIAHGAGVDIAHTVLVKIRKGQRLQMGKDRIAQVPVDLHLHLTALVQTIVIVQFLQDHQQNVEKQKDRHSFQGPLRHKMIQCPAVEQRKYGIRQTGQDTQKDHQQNGLHIWSQIGHDQRNAEIRRPLPLVFLVFFHSCGHGLSFTNMCDKNYALLRRDTQGKSPEKGGSAGIRGGLRRLGANLLIPALIMPCAYAVCLCRVFMPCVYAGVSRPAASVCRAYTRL